METTLKRTLRSFNWKDRVCNNHLVASRKFDFVVDNSLKRDIQWNLLLFVTHQFPTHNSDREDIFYEPGMNRFNTKHTDSLHSRSPIPANERNQFRWNANPFDVSANGDGMMQLDPGAYLLSYWMARYYDILGQTD